MNSVISLYLKLPSFFYPIPLILLLIPLFKLIFLLNLFLIALLRNQVLLFLFFLIFLFHTSTIPTNYFTIILIFNFLLPILNNIFR